MKTHRKFDRNSKNDPNINGLSFRGEGGGHTSDSEGSSMAAADRGRPAKQAIAEEDKRSNYSGDIDMYEPFLNGEIPFSGNDALANVEGVAPARIEAAVLGAFIMAKEKEGDLYICRTGLRNQVNGFLLKDNHTYEKEAAELLAALIASQQGTALSQE